MSDNRENVWRIALALVAALLLAGACAPATPQVVEKEVVVKETVVVEREVEKEVEKEVVVTPTPEKPSGTVVLWAFPDWDSVLGRVAESFKAVQPDVEVRIEALGYGDLHDKLLTSLAAGTGAPDLATVEFFFLAKFIGQPGGLVDLGAPPFNGAMHASKFLPYKWAQSHSPDGVLRAFPMDMGPVNFYYRADVLEKVGMSLEDVQNIETWEEWIEVGQEFMRRAEAQGLKVWWTDNAANLFNIAYWQFRIGFVNREGSPAVDSPEAMAALSLAKAVRDAGLDGQFGMWSPEWQLTFKEGSVAAYANGQWLLGQIRNWLAPDTCGNWRAAYIPMLTDMNYPHVSPGERPGAEWGGTWFVIPEQSQNKLAAWAFIEYASATLEGQKAQFPDVFPALVEIYEDPTLDSPVDCLGGQQPLTDVWLRTAENTSPIVVMHPADQLIGSIVGEEVGLVLNEGKDPGQALADAAGRIGAEVR